MTTLVTLIVIAAIGGAAVSIQAQLVGLIDTNLGTLESVFISYGGGGLLIGLIMLLMRGGNLGAWQQVPWYCLLAGVFGLIIVASISYCTPRIGVVAALTILVAAQFLAGALIDHFGLLGAEVRPLTISKLTGIAATLTGTWLVIR